MIQKVCLFKVLNVLKLVFQVVVSQTGTLISIFMLQLKTHRMKILLLGQLLVAEKEVALELMLVKSILIPNMYNLLKT